MATPFSPYVGRMHKPAVKRRQSQLPSDLIDWDAPEIPELEKQRIIFEDHIRELTEDHAIDTLLNDEIFQVAHNSVVDEYKKVVKALETDVTNERTRVNLLLGQLKMFEQKVQESEERVDELENQVSGQKEAIAVLEQEKQTLSQDKESWAEERTAFQNEIENLNFRNNETACELNHNIEIYMQKKNEAEDTKKKYEAVKNQLSYYKKLAKNRANFDDQD